MRNRVRAQGIGAPRGAFDGGSEAWWGSVGVPIPGVFVRVAGKGLTRQRVRKSGKPRTYKEAFLRFGATQEFPKGKEVGDLGADRGDHG
jgi:hypothetical protein